MLDVESRALILETRSPVHIGWHGQNYGLGTVKPRDDTIYVVDQDKLLKKLMKYGLLDSFVSEFSDPVKIREYTQTLRTFIDNLDDTKKRQFNTELASIASAQANSGNRNAFIRDGSGRVIIPGSTIKGALRTAVAYHHLNQEKTRGEKAFLQEFDLYVNKKLAEYRALPPGRKRNFGKDLDAAKVDVIFGSCPHDDLFRAVAVTDGFPDKETAPEQVKIIRVDSQGETDFHKYRDRTSGNLTDTSFRRQCLSDRAQATVSLRIDKNIIKWWEEAHGEKSPFTNIDELLGIAGTFARDQRDFEQRFLTNVKLANTPCGNLVQPLRDFYRDNLSNVSLRIGWGTGLLGTTIDLLLDDSSLINPIRQKIRAMLPPGNNYAGPVPKTRRVVIRSASCFPLGWISLRTVK